MEGRGDRGGLIPELGAKAVDGTRSGVGDVAVRYLSLTKGESFGLKRIVIENWRQWVEAEAEMGGVNFPRLRRRLCAFSERFRDVDLLSCRDLIHNKYLRCYEY